MSWGVRLIGMSNVLKGLKDIQMRLDDNVVYVTGTNVEYAVYPEFGTSKMPAQPYLMPAMREAERNIQRIAGDAQSVEEAVKRIALFIERRAAENAPVLTGNLQGSIRAERIK